MAAADPFATHFWEQQLLQGHHLTAIGGSDNHHADWPSTEAGLHWLSHDRHLRAEPFGRRYPRRNPLRPCLSSTSRAHATGCLILSCKRRICIREDGRGSRTAWQRRLARSSCGWLRGSFDLFLRRRRDIAGSPPGFPSPAATRLFVPNGTRMAVAIACAWRSAMQMIICSCSAIPIYFGYQSEKVH